MKRLIILGMLLTLLVANTGCRRGLRWRSRGAPCRTYAPTAPSYGSPYGPPAYATPPAYAPPPTYGPQDSCCPPCTCYDSGCCTSCPPCDATGSYPSYPAYEPGVNGSNIPTYPMEPSATPPVINQGSGTMQSTMHNPIPGQAYFSHVVGDRRVETDEKLTSSEDES